MIIISANRSLALTPAWNPPLTWPVSEPNDSLTYGLDVSAALLDSAEEIFSASVCAAPSGAGELSVNSIFFSNREIFVSLSGGVPGRIYRVKITATTFSDRIFIWYVNLPIDATLASFPISIAPSPFFSAPISVDYLQSMSIVMALWFATLPTVPQGGTPPQPWNDGGILVFS
jgi:hypothetical protein